MIVIFYDQNLKSDNYLLRKENEKLQLENSILRETNVTNCPYCGPQPTIEEEPQLCLQQLLIENSQLKEEVCKRLNNI